MALPGVGADHTDKLFFGVTNVGRRPIMVAKVGGAHGGKYFLVTPHAGTIPRMLAPGEYVHE